MGLFEPIIAVMPRAIRTSEHEALRPGIHRLVFSSPLSQQHRIQRRQPPSSRVTRRGQRRTIPCVSSSRPWRHPSTSEKPLTVGRTLLWAPGANGKPRMMKGTCWSRLWRLRITRNQSWPRASRRCRIWGRGIRGTRDGRVESGRRSRRRIDHRRRGWPRGQSADCGSSTEGDTFPPQVASRSCSSWLVVRERNESFAIPPHEK